MSNFKKAAILFLPAWSIDSPPLGVACIAAVLEEKGIDVDLFDLNILIRNKCLKKYGNEWNEHYPIYWNDQSSSAIWKGYEIGKHSMLPSEAEEIIEQVIMQQVIEEYDLFCYSIFDSNRKSTYLAHQLLRKKSPHACALFGGPSVKDIFLPNGKVGPATPLWLTDRDRVIFGEAEDTLFHLLDKWNEPHIKLPGLFYTHNNDVIYTKPAPSSYNIPSYEKLELGVYHDPIIPIEVARGCVASCAFCTEKNLSPNYRTRDISEVIAIIRKVHKLLPVEKRFFTFTGPVINGKKNYVLQLSESIINEALGINWGGSFRITNELTIETIGLMRRSGCQYINAGIESASPRLIKLMNKNIDIDWCRTVIQNLKLADIMVSINIITGFPTETDEDHLLTIKFLEDVMPFLYDVHVSPCQVFTDSALALNPEKFSIDPQTICQDPSQWLSIDGKNTLEVRIQRAQDIIALLKKNNVRWIAPFESKLEERIG